MILYLIYDYTASKKTLFKEGIQNENEEVIVLGMPN